VDFLNSSSPAEQVQDQSHHQDYYRKPMNKEKCPFKVGDTVAYRPSNRGHALDIMIDPQLRKGGSYKIVRIDNDVYVVIEGFEKAAGGGIYWTEFSAE